MLDLSNPDCLWTGELCFNELLQSIVSFTPVLFAYQAELALNMSTLSYSFGG